MINLIINRFIIFLISLVIFCNIYQPAKAADTYYVTYGPIGTPDTSRDRASEIFNLLNANGYSVTEIDEWSEDGGWNSNFGNIFGNFEITTGKGYLIQFNSNPGTNWINILSPDTEVTTININLIPGYNLISIPEGALTGHTYTVEDLCQLINNQGGQTTDVSYLENNLLINSFVWTIHNCGSNENNPALKKGVGYFIANNIYSTFTISKAVTPSPAPFASVTNTSTNTPHAPGCPDSPPITPPNLFEIDVTNTTATLNYLSAKDNLNYHYVSYSLYPDRFMYGVSFNQSQKPGILTYTINQLMPNTTYYFMMRGGNGCAPGRWSQTMKITTSENNQINKFYFYN